MLTGEPNTSSHPHLRAGLRQCIGQLSTQPVQHIGKTATLCVPNAGRPEAEAAQRRHYHAHSLRGGPLGAVQQPAESRSCDRASIRFQEPQHRGTKAVIALQLQVARRTIFSLQDGTL